MATPRSPWLLALLALGGVEVARALHLHSRRRDRHRRVRRLTDRSTVLARCDVMVRLASAAPTGSLVDLSAFPELARLQTRCRTIPDQALRLHQAGHVHASEHCDDLAFHSFFERGWKRFHLL